MTALIAYLLLGEPLSIRNMIGTAVVIGIGAVLYVVAEKGGNEQVNSNTEEWCRGIIPAFLSMARLACSHVCIRKGLLYGVEPFMGFIVRAASTSVASWMLIAIMRRTQYDVRQLSSSGKALPIVLVAGLPGTTSSNMP